MHLFGEELMRIGECYLEPPFPLENGREGLCKILSGPYLRLCPIEINVSKTRQDVIALKSIITRTIKTHINYQINSVVFNDGTVLDRK